MISVFLAALALFCGCSQENRSDPADKPAGQPADQKDEPAEQPAEQPADPPAETPAEKPAEKPAEQPAENPPAQPKDEPAIQKDQDPAAAHPEIAAAWARSLHATTAGIRFWYEAADGLGGISKIPFGDTGCGSCHSRDCNSCHGEEKDGKVVFSAAKAGESKSCLKCHFRSAALSDIDRNAGTQDVHARAGFECSKCHRLHGTGMAERKHMRDSGGTQAECTACHKSGGKPGYYAETKPHSKHKGKLHCNACHVSGTIALCNLSFDEFLKTKQLQGSFLETRKIGVMLVNYKGQVTSANVQTVVFRKKTFAAFAPCFTHSISGKARGCADCHGIEAALKMKAGEKVAVTWWKDGKVEALNGVIPVVPSLMEFAFLDKAEGGWEPLEAGPAPLVQFMGDGSPLTDAQIRKMAMKFK